MTIERRDILASSNTYVAREDAYAPQYQTWAKDKYGVELSRDHLWESPAFRLFILTGEQIGNVKDELVRDNDSIRQAAKTIEIQSALTDRGDPQHDALMAELSALPPHERIRRARELGLEGNSTNKAVEKVNDPVAKQKIIQEIYKLPLSMRISAARARGVA